MFYSICEDTIFFLYVDLVICLFVVFINVNCEMPNSPPLEGGRGEEMGSQTCQV